MPPRFWRNSRCGPLTELEVVSSDTNVIFDFQVGGILSLIGRFKFERLITDLVEDELESVSLRELQRAGYKTVKLTGDQVQKLHGLYAAHQSTVSLADLSAMVAAEVYKAILLTGDKGLRKIAEDQSVEVHGTLWLLDELVAAKAITMSDASAALSNMLNAGRRLPHAEATKRIHAWNK